MQNKVLHVQQSLPELNIKKRNSNDLERLDSKKNTEIFLVRTIYKVKEILVIYIISLKNLLN